MKKVILGFAVLAIIFISTSCNSKKQEPVAQKPTPTTVTSIEVTYSNQGFLIETQMVVKGNTVWGISKEKYGTGTMWRDIIAKNPFLNDPTRLHYDSEKSMWIVRIYPGEVLNIGAQQVNPVFTYKETVTKIEPSASAPTSSPSMPGWMWIIIAIIAGGALVGIAALLKNRSMFIDVRDGIDSATRLTMNKRENKFNEKALKFLSESSKSGRLEEFKFTTASMNMEVIYTATKNPFKEKKEKRKKIDKKIDKKSKDKKGDAPATNYAKPEETKAE